MTEQHFALASLDEFLTEYGAELGKEAEEALNPLHVPGRDQPQCAPLLRQPFEPQAHVVTALAKLWQHQKAAELIAEMGTGKTLMACGTVETHASRLGKRSQWAYRAAVFCPGILTKKWQRELWETVPGALCMVIHKWTDLLAIPWDQKPKGKEWYIFGRDRSKLSCGWAPAAWRKTIPVKDDAGRVAEGSYHRGIACPTCGREALDGDGLPRGEGWLYAKGAPPRTCEWCKGALWQDMPKPRRMSPALYAKKRCGFDYLIADEAHEEKGVDSLQARALSDLASCSTYKLALTGTLVGGYAWHVRTLQFRLGAGKSLVDMGLGWKDEQAFNERYGRIETRITTTEGGSEEGHTYGRQKKSQRKDKYVRPGIMPTLFGDHLVSNCVFLTLDELADNLPDFKEDVIEVPLGILEEPYRKVEKDLMEEIRQMLRKGDKRLLGTMLHCLLCYPDHPFDWTEIGYLDRTEHGNFWRSVTCPPNLDPSVTYPKEQALLETIEHELQEGRQAWVYSVYNDKRDVTARLRGLLAAKGIRVKVLQSSVPPEEREEWIAREGPKQQVIVSHPQLVQTGLDFFAFDAPRLDYAHNFCSILFYETGYSLFTLMQAARRAWRIGQRRDCRCYYYCYAASMQARALALMGQKAAAANAISGRFSAEGLAAMGGEDETAEMALAKSLAERTADHSSACRAWAKLTTKLAQNARRDFTEDEQAALLRELEEVEALSQGLLFPGHAA